MSSLTLAGPHGSFSLDVHTLDRPSPLGEVDYAHASAECREFRGMISGFLAHDQLRAFCTGLGQLVSGAVITVTLELEGAMNVTISPSYSPDVVAVVGELEQTVFIEPLAPDKGQPYRWAVSFGFWCPRSQLQGIGDIPWVGRYVG
jgi:hypothetical protein